MSPGGEKIQDATGDPLLEMTLQSGSELAQAGVRLKLTTLYLLALGFFWGLNLRAFVLPVIFPALVYFAFGLLWLGIIKKNILPIQQRKYVSILFDHAIFGYAYYSGGEAIAVIFWVPIFATIGYGLRFGSRYAYLSAAVSTLLLGIAMVFSPFWQAHWPPVVGILLGGVALPVYAIKLAESLSRSRHAAENLALQLEQLNRVDQLTGLLNRKGLDYQFARCCALKTSGVLMYLDLDGFKQVNDSVGHAAGDDILREVAVVLHSCLRSSDAIARLGGDEFAILVTRLSARDAVEIAEKIILEISCLPIKGCNQFRLGVSIGAVQFAAQADSDIRALLLTADQLMYEAKRAGKNRARFPELHEQPTSGAFVSH